jgi:hypothetical protein
MTEFPGGAPVRRHWKSRGLGLVAAICWMILIAWVASAEFDLSTDGERAGRAEAAEPYRDGPIRARDAIDVLELPNGAGELLGLSALVAFLYGLRVCGLSR